MDLEIEKRFEKLDESLRQVEWQILARTCRETKRLTNTVAASQEKTDEQLDSLAASVQAFIDSQRKNGNGSKHRSLRTHPFSRSCAGRD